METIAEGSSQDEQFESASKCLELDFRRDVLPKEITFRCPESKFEGESMSAYFKLKSESLQNIGKWQSNDSKLPSFTSFASNFAIDISKCDASFTNVMNDISASDDTLTISKKIMRQRSLQKFKSLNNVTKDLSVFRPTAHSTELSLLSPSFVEPLLEESVLCLKLPLFVKYKLENLQVKNSSSNFFKLRLINSDARNNFEIYQAKPCIIPALFMGSVNTEVFITPLSIGQFTVTLEFLFELFDKENKYKKTSAKFLCKFNVNEFQISHSSKADSDINLSVWESTTIIESFRITPNDFDINVPLEFKLTENDSVSFALNCDLKEDLVYRCTEKNILKTFSKKNVDVLVPFFIGSKAFKKVELAVYLDTEYRRLIQTFNLNIHILEKKLLKGPCLQAEPCKLSVAIGKKTKVYLRNRSERDAISVSIYLDDSEKTEVEFSEKQFIILPRVKKSFTFCVKSSTDNSFNLKFRYNGGIPGNDYIAHLPIVMNTK